MKTYETPAISVVKIDTRDVIATEGNTRYGFVVNPGEGNTTSAQENWLSGLQG